MVMDMKQPFESVVVDHGATVLRVCRAVLGSHSDADDAWSETFLAAMKAWPDLPADANIEAWLVTIAHRKAIDVTRARQRHPIAGGEPPEQSSTIGVPEPEHVDMWRALKALPDKQRKVVAYHFLGGLPYQDVADLLGGTSAAARRAASDGITSLRRALAGGQRSGGTR